MKLKFLAFAVALTLATNLSAQTFTTLHSFTTNTDGAFPYTGLVLSGNTLYGTTRRSYDSGGIYNANGTLNGTLFAVNTDGSRFQALYNMNDGAGVAHSPASLIVSGHTLYGATLLGGIPENGTVFAANTDGTDLTNLHSFSLTASGTNSDGVNPMAGLTLSGNTLYGTATRGGNSDYGTVFAINTDGTGFTTLYNFTATSQSPNYNYTNTDGCVPLSTLALSGNTLYGTASEGGNSGCGTVFAINTDGKGFTTLYNFTATPGGYAYTNSYGLNDYAYTNSDGANPVGFLILSGNTLYGTTIAGGYWGNGTIFRINMDGTHFTNLYSFNFHGDDWPEFQNRGLTLSGNTLYGNTPVDGSSGSGTVFAINTDGTGYTTLYKFTATTGDDPWWPTNNDGAIPSGKLVLSGNTLYGTALYGGASGYGTVFALSLAPSAPTITTEPQSQTAQIGDNVNFTVAASIYPPPTYQWQFNGQNIAGQTAASLSLTNVQFANAGGYLVIVTNAYGSVTSATASLAILGDGANGNTPVQPTRSSLPAKSSSAKNLVFVTHGWEPLQPNADLSWMAEMTNDIAQQLPAKGQLSNWQFETYSWLQDASTLDPDTALNTAINLGKKLGTQLAAQSWQQIHLIAHSAGAGMIQEIADVIHTNSPSTVVQTTFLDPFTGLDNWALSWYGSNAAWSDEYYVAIDETSLDPVATGFPLPKTFAVDVSWVDPDHQQAQYIGPGGGPVALSSHGYPIDFYTQSIINTDPSWSGAGYGFILSMEDDGASWINTQINNPVGSGPILPNSPANAVQNPNSGLGEIESVELGIIINLGNAAYAASGPAATLIGDAGLELQSIWSSLPLVKSAGVQPMGGPVPLGGSSGTNSPAWLAVGVSAANEINFVQFDAAFTDTNSAQGLLTVCWNTNQIGMVDERVVETNLQTYRFQLPGTVSSGLYTLSFRLDSFNNSSSIAVTNVATGFVGVTQPITLGISLTNGAPLLQLTAATNFTYLIQSSTNLVDWTPTVLLLNTNGTTKFTDSAVTNSSARFYRALLQ